MLLNALTKVIYAVMREKYGLSQELLAAEKRSNQRKAPTKKKRKRSRDSSDSSSSS